MTTPPRPNPMLDHGYTFEAPETEGPIIKVIGVGGGGSNAVKHMVETGVKDVEFAICNTDRQALQSITNKNVVKVQLGTGLGAGMDTEEGRRAAEESIDDLRALLAPPIKMLFITAGMGGGTGTGAAPVIAQLAREMGLLTVAVVTAPYKYEGTEKKEQAMRGIELLKEYCDTVLVVLNDKLAELYGKLPLRKAFANADNVLATAVKSIAEIITTRGDVNTDFKDVAKVLNRAGQSVMGSADAEGDDRAIRAIEEALNSPLLNDRDIRGAKRILLTIASSTEFEAIHDEQTVISDYILDKIGEEARLFKLGAIFDDSLGPKLRVTVIAAGFELNEKAGFPLHKGNYIRPVTLPAKKPTVSAAPGTTFAPTPTPAETPDYNYADTLTPTYRPPGEMPIFVQPLDPANGYQVSGEQADQFHLNRPDDTEQIKQLLNDVLNGRYTERDMEAPAFLRHRAVLYETPLLPETELIRSRLHD